MCVVDKYILQFQTSTDIQLPGRIHNSSPLRHENPDGTTRVCVSFWGFLSDFFLGCLGNFFGFPGDFFWDFLVIFFF